MSNASSNLSVTATELLRVILDAVGDPVFVKDREHRFVLLNDACCQLFGVEPDAWLGKTEHELGSGFRVSLSSDGDRLMFETGEDQVSEQTLTDSEGRMRMVSIRKSLFRNGAGEPFLVAVLHDVTERKQAVRLLLHQALHDRLTGLGNRVLFERYLRKATDDAKRFGKGLAVICFDPDRFNVVNETLGHHAGDRLLVAIARRLQSVLRPDDHVARLSGDEFACLVENCEGTEDARRIADRVQEAFRQPFHVEKTQAHVSLSIGIAWSPGAEASEDLLRFSDVALRRAKRKGASSEVFDAGIDTAATERFHAQNELQRALQQEELVLYYQPLVEMESGRVTGVEALVRWLHPTRGLVPPDQFIPLAEESGLIVPLGDWVLQEACRQKARWQRQLGLGCDFIISVNVSAKQLRDPGLAARTLEILGQTGLRADELVLELTENVLLEETARARELRDLGVRLAIDDFGTGYASLGYLRDLPVSMLKIARPFISKLGRDVVDTSLVNMILTLVQDLGLLSVAEGVEDQKQAKLLRELRCNFAQGFLFAKPMPVAELERFVTGNSFARRPAPPAAVYSPPRDLVLQSA